MIAALGAALVATLALAACSCSLAWLGEGGTLPIRRQVWSAVGGGASAALVNWMTQPAGQGEWLAALLGPGASLARIAALCALLAVLAGVVVLLALRGERLAGPTLGVAYGCAFAGGAFTVTSGASLLRRAAPAPQLLADGAAALGFAAVLGCLAGAGRLRADRKQRAALWVGAVMAGGAALAAHVGARHGGTPAVAPETVVLASGLSLAIAAAAITAGWLVEGGVLRRELLDEVRLGVIPAGMQGLLTSPRALRRSDRWPRVEERRSITRLLTELAFRKYSLRQLAGERAQIYSLEVGRLRERVRRLLGSQPDEEGAGEPVQ
jgi:hypothetical protein